MHDAGMSRRRTPVNFVIAQILEFMSCLEKHM